MIFLNFNILLQASGLSTGNNSLIWGLGILCLFFLFISATATGAEQAFSHLEEKDLLQLKAEDNLNVVKITRLLERPRFLFVSLFVIRILCYLFLIYLLSAFLDMLVNAFMFPAFSIFLEILIIFFLIALFAETLPRAYAQQRKIRMVAFATPLTASLLALLKPFTEAVLSASDFLSDKIFNSQDQDLGIKDIEKAFSKSRSIIEAEERDILKALFNFGNITARQVMKARPDIIGVEEGSSFEEVIKKFTKFHYSRMLVYKDSIDYVTGILQLKDILEHLDEKGFDWLTVNQKPIFIYEQKPVNELLKEFQRDHFWMAVVVDEFGGTKGIVTLEDIMEVVMGEMPDGLKNTMLNYEKISENEFLFDGKILLNEVIRLLDLPVDYFKNIKGEIDTLGGLVLELAEGFPDLNTALSYNALTLTPLEMNDFRISKIKVVLSGEDESPVV